MNDLSVAFPRHFSVHISRVHYPTTQECWYRRLWTNAEAFSGKYVESCSGVTNGARVQSSPGQQAARKIIPRLGIDRLSRVTSTVKWQFSRLPWVFQSRWYVPGQKEPSCKLCVVRLRYTSRNVDLLISTLMHQQIQIYDGKTWWKRRYSNWFIEPTVYERYSGKFYNATTRKKKTTHMFSFGACVYIRVCIYACTCVFTTRSQRIQWKRYY